jgi:hypothetical protein
VVICATAPVHTEALDYALSALRITIASLLLHRRQAIQVYTLPQIPKAQIETVALSN